MAKFSDENLIHALLTGVIFAIYGYFHFDNFNLGIIGFVLGVAVSIFRLKSQNRNFALRYGCLFLLFVLFEFGIFFVNNSAVREMALPDTPTAKSLLVGSTMLLVAAWIMNTARFYLGKAYIVFKLILIGLLVTLCLLKAKIEEEIQESFKTDLIAADAISR